MLQTGDRFNRCQVQAHQPQDETSGLWRACDLAARRLRCVHAGWFAWQDQLRKSLAGEKGWEPL